MKSVKVFLLFLLVSPRLLDLIRELICSQLLVGVHIQMISINGNIEFTLIVMFAFSA